MDKTTVKFSENETIAIQFMALCVSDLPGLIFILRGRQHD